MSVSEKASSRPKGRVLAWILSILVVLISVVLIGLPYLIKYEAVKWLQSHGAEQARIDDVDLNLFAGTFQVDNLVVQAGGGTPMRIRQIAGDIKMLDLFNKRAVVQSLWLYGGHLSIVQAEDGGLTIGGIKPPKSAPAAEPASTEKSAWTFGLNTAVLADTTLEYHAPELEQNFYVNAAYVFDMHSWEPDRPARVGIDMHINNQPFTASSDVRAFALEPDTLAQMELQGLNLGDFAVLAGLADVKNLSGKVSFNLALNAVQQERGQTRLAITGDLMVRDLRADYADMSIAQGLLHYTGNINLRLHGPADVPMIAIDGALKSQDSSFVMADLKVKHAALAWNTATQIFNAEAKNAPLRINARGEGSVDSLVVDDTKKRLNLANVKHIDIKGADIQLPERAAVENITVDETSALESASAESSLPELSFKQLHLGQAVYDFPKKSMSVMAVGLGNLLIRDKAKKLILADVEKIEVGQVALTLEQGVTVARVEVSDLNAVRLESKSEENERPLTSVGKTAVRKISFTFDPPRIEVDSVDLGELEANFIREADGTLSGLAQLTSSKDAEPPPKTQAADSAPAKDEMLSIRLGSLKVADDAEIHWTDNKVKPQVNITVKPLSLALGPLDTAKPSARTNVELLASLHKNNEIKFKGYISPLDPKPNSRLNGTIQGLNLTGFSTYAAVAGYTLHSGRLDANIAAKVTDGELDMLNKLVLTKLQLEGDGGGGRDAMSGATALPLNVALGYLRDNEDRIKFSVPVTGNIRDPKFNFNDVIRLATQAAAQEAAMTYLTQALQPLGAVLLVGKLAKKAANALQLQEITFKPGDAALDDTAQAYVEKISKILNSRPGIKLTICGTATESDRAALLAMRTEQAKAETTKEKPDAEPDAAAQTEISDDELLKLAGQRSNEVSDLLVGRYKVNPDQLFDCRPVVDGEAAAVPNVTLGI